MTRILTITNWYPPHHYGGYELSCFDVMTRLEARGHHVSVLCSDQRLEQTSPETVHEQVVDRSLRMYHTGEDLYVPPIRVRWAIERHNQRMLVDALDRVRPDVISVWHLAALSHGLLATVAARGIPVVFVVCDEWLNFGIKLDQWARLFHRNRATRAAGRLVTAVTRTPTVVGNIGELGPALYVSDDVRRRTHERSPFRFVDETVTYSGIERSLFAPPTPGPRPWGWRLLATGRFDPRKGFETAIRALPMLPEQATLSIFGRGGTDERNRLRTVADELGLGDRVALGTLEREEMAAAYGEADAYVFPSEWAEPFGLVPIEAMACHIPVVGTGVGGSGEFLFDGHNHLAFPPGDAAGLATRLRELADHPELRARLVRNGSATADAMDVERLADTMEAWHVHAAGGRRSEDRPPDRHVPRPN